MKHLLSVPILGRLLFLLADWRTNEKVNQIQPLIPPQATVLDIGAGNCLVAHKLNRSTTLVDTQNHSFLPHLNPILYDGHHLPFKSKHFDYALLLTVLHHTPNPDAIISDAARVAKHLIILEETYTNNFQKYLTFAIDSLFNLEFFHHPHTNRTDPQWQSIFKKLNLKLTQSSRSPSLFHLLTRHLYTLNC